LALAAAGALVAFLREQPFNPQARLAQVLVVAAAVRQQEAVKAVMEATLPSLA
jgi:hypothetical protein